MESGRDGNLIGTPRGTLIGTSIRSPTLYYPEHVAIAMEQESDGQLTSLRNSSLKTNYSHGRSESAVPLRVLRMIPPSFVFLSRSQSHFLMLGDLNQFGHPGCHRDGCYLCPGAQLL